MKYVRICPVCGSIDVSPDLSNPAAVVSGALYMYKCNRCGFVGNSILFPEVPVNEVPEPKNLEEIKRYPVSEINLYSKGLLKCMIPMLLFLLLIFILLFYI